VLKLKNKIYGLIQEPLVFYQVCSKVYQKVGYTQLKSDECVFIHKENNVKTGSKSAKNRKLISTLADISTIPEQDRIYKDCIHEFAVVFILIYVDNTFVRSNCETLVKSLRISLPAIILATSSTETAYMFLSDYITRGLVKFERVDSKKQILDIGTAPRP